MAENRDFHEFEGTLELQPTEEERARYGVAPYLPENGLRDAVNLAIFLKRPLLLRGVPGCGKTQLARAVQYEFTRKDPRFALDGERWPLLEWAVKSTSEAQDGIYVYDAVGRLRDAQLTAMRNRQGGVPGQLGPNKTIRDYISYGKLGQAFQETRCRPLVLIDEIDKADIDFPNDLLTILEDRYFEINETSERIEAHPGKEPIIFITSNDEKDLPEAFLRRCVFYYIDFPSEERLLEIARERFRFTIGGDQPVVDDELLKKVTARFNRLRGDQSSAGKPVSTSELIDWLDVLLFYGDLTRDERRDIMEALASDTQELPHTSVLLKTQTDRDTYVRQLDARRKAQGQA